MAPFSAYFSVVLALSLVACAGGGTVVTGAGAEGGAPVPSADADKGPATDTTPAAADIVGCSFRVSGATVDKVSESPTVARIVGSTLTLECQLASSTELQPQDFLVVAIKAFDGPGDYVLDQDGVHGDLKYVGNDSLVYIAGRVGGGEALKSSCTFTFLEGPTDPKPGATVAATFHCEGLQGYHPNYGSSGEKVPTVDIVRGSFKATVK
jgi:hypothetical protein